MPKTVTIGDRVFTILFPDLIRPLLPDERARLKESVARYGVKDAIHTDGKDGVIDGGNRLEIAGELGFTDPDAIPIQTHEDCRPEELRELAEQLNDCRRQQTKEEIEARRQKRIAEAVELRKQGLSTRAIAAKVGVSHIQIQKDLEAADKLSSSVGNRLPTRTSATENNAGNDLSNSGVPSGTPRSPAVAGPAGNGQAPAQPPLKVVGKDGKKYAATKPKPKSSPRREAEAPEVPLDGMDNPVPPNLVKFFVDEAHRDLVAELGSHASELRKALVHVQEICRANKWAELSQIAPGLASDVVAQIEQSQRFLKNALPYVVHGPCSGSGCKDCRQTGFLPRWRAEELALQEQDSA